MGAGGFRSEELGDGVGICEPVDFRTMSES